MLLDSNVLVSRHVENRSFYVNGTQTSGDKLCSFIITASAPPRLLLHSVCSGTVAGSSQLTSIHVSPLGSYCPKHQWQVADGELCVICLLHVCGRVWEELVWAAAWGELASRLLPHSTGGLCSCHTCS